MKEKEKEPTKSVPAICIHCNTVQGVQWIPLKDPSKERWVHCSYCFEFGTPPNTCMHTKQSTTLCLRKD